MSINLIIYFYPPNKIKVRIFIFFDLPCYNLQHMNWTIELFNKFLFLTLIPGFIYAIVYKATYGRSLTPTLAKNIN